MLRLSRNSYEEMIAHALDGMPLEACGVFAGDPHDGDATVHHFYPCRNEAASAKVYTLAPLDHLKAERDAEGRGWEVLGVMHSHTHTDAYPSPTDVAQAPDPAWHYVIVSLRDDEPSLRSYRIADGAVTEEPVVLVDPAEA